jgi:hypothetical protein
MRAAISTTSLLVPVIGERPAQQCIAPAERARLFQGRFGVDVPLLDPVTDVGFEGVDAFADAALSELGGEASEPALDLV